MSDIDRLIAEMRVTNALHLMQLSEKNAPPCGYCGARPVVTHVMEYGPVCAGCKTKGSVPTDLPPRYAAASAMFMGAERILNQWLESK